MLAEVPAMIAPEDDDGITSKGEAIQFSQHITQQLIGIAGAGEVSVAHHPMEVIRVFIKIPQMVGAEFTAAFQLLRGVIWASPVVGELYFFRVVEIPVFLGGVEWQVRADKAAGKKEGFAFLLETLEI